jgi:L-ornithine N5-oxygenase
MTIGTTWTDQCSVNEIFNPARVDCTYSREPKLRSTTLVEDKGTNYGVVRLNLLEHIYETLYMQRIRYGNSAEEEAQWPHRIMPYRRVVEVEDSAARKGGVRLHVQDRSPLYFSEVAGAKERTEVLDVDAVFVATGYFRDLHETLLKDARHLMPGGDLQDAKWTVQRDYRVKFENKAVSEEAGVWLQGCCETTHGVSSFVWRRSALSTC